jgi:hypothetical protein
MESSSASWKAFRRHGNSLGTFDRRLATVAADLRQEMAGLRADVRTEMAGNCADLRAEMADIATGLRAEMQQGFERIWTAIGLRARCGVGFSDTDLRTCREFVGATRRDLVARSKIAEHLHQRS